MKPKSNHALLGLIAAGSLAVSGSASASFLLAGFHDFNTSFTAEPADRVFPGVAATVSKQTGFSSFTSGGSNDGTFGSGVSSTPFQTPAVPTNDGYLRIGPNVGGNNMTITVDNNGTTPISLESLLFDVAGATIGTSFNVSYVLFPSFGSTPVTATQAFTTQGASETYGNHSFLLNGIGLDAGSTISFFFQNMTGNARIDNIALLAVPEPGSILALGCVLGSGLLLRNRRRSSNCAEVAA